MAVATRARSTGTAATVHVAGETLSAFLDDELTVEEHRRVEAHLRVCCTCREIVAAYRAHAGFVKRLPVQPVPRGLGAALMRRLQAAA